MGYFANLYVAELTSTSAGVKSRIEVYGSEVAAHAYFSFGDGIRPAGLQSYADGGVVSDLVLKLLPGYPLLQTESTDPESCLFSTSFDPRAGDDPVLYHFVLPERFLP